MGWGMVRTLSDIEDGVLIKLTEKVLLKLNFAKKYTDEPRRRFRSLPD